MPSTDLTAELIRYQTELAEYADYRELSSVDRARKYVTAATKLLGMLPRSVALANAGGETVTMDLAVLERLRKEAQQYVYSKQLATNQTVAVDLRWYRE